MPGIRCLVRLAFAYGALMLSRSPLRAVCAIFRKMRTRMRPPTEAAKGKAPAAACRDCRGVVGQGLIWTAQRSLAAPLIA
jgi:hypothetical protein